MKLTRTTLDKLGFVGRGRSRHRPRNDQSLFGGRYPFIQTGEVKAANLYISSFYETYNDKGLAQSKLWDEDTLLITIAANIADTAILKIKACFPDSIVAFIPYKNVSDVKYVKYYIDYIKLELKAISQGTTQDNMSLDKLLSRPIYVHNYPTQKKIASILSTYDDLIENNNQRIKLLEEMAEEIYKEWFVRMRFPGYQDCKFFDKEGNEVPHGTVGALPEGWSQEQLGRICNIQMGQSPKSEFYNEDQIGLPFHQGVTNFEDRFPIHKMYCSDLKRIAEDSDILLSVRAPVGRINIANRKLVIGRGLSSLRHNRGLQNYFFYLLKDVFKIEDSFGNGAVFNAVSKTDLESVKINKAHPKVDQAFQELIEPLDSEIKVLTTKNQTLQETRDLLLPRLISGKLDVSKLVIDEPENLSMAAEPHATYN